MIKFILALLLIPQLAFAGLPPTSSKVVGDSTNVTTFNFQFPNFAATRSGPTTTFGLMNANGLAAGSTGQVLGVSGGVATWVNGAGVSIAPTVQVFTSGSGTYTRPSSPAPLFIKIKMAGGGGGGGGSGTSGYGTGGSGSASTFGTSLLTANGGGGGAGSSAGAGGGSATISAPAYGLALTGGAGGSAVYSGNTWAQGNAGGTTPLGGAGYGGSGAYPGSSGSANTGAGGGGGGNNAPDRIPGAGGGAGGYIEATISNPSSTYSYAVGGGGSAGGAGANGYTGGAGGSGIIIVEEYYSYTYITAAAGSTTQPGVTISASTTANQSQYNFFCNATSGNVVVSLPQISSLGSSNNAHQNYCLKKIDASANTCQFAAFSGDTIDGATTSTITAQYTNRCIIDNAGTAWYVH